MPNSEKVQLEVLIASDHGGYELKEYVKERITKYKWIDLGTESKKSVDYPDYAAKVAKEIQANPSKRGILICGTGIGMSIAANRFKGIRAAVLTDSFTAKMSRMHNDANVLCLGARVIGTEQAIDIIETWLRTPFAGDSGNPEGDRNRKRLEKIDGLTKTK